MLKKSCLLLTTSCLMLGAMPSLAERQPAGGSTAEMLGPGSRASVVPVARMVVLTDRGRIVRQTPGVRRAERLAIGSYEILFDTNVRECYYFATIGNVGTGRIVPTIVTTAARAGKSNGVFVRTYNRNTGNPRDSSFHLTVLCAR